MVRAMTVDRMFGGSALKKFKVWPKFVIGQI
jgi:hypothetical protein